MLMDGPGTKWRRNIAENFISDRQSLKWCCAFIDSGL